MLLYFAYYPQVAGGANFVITGLDQLKEGAGNNIVVMEQLERANEQVAESQDNNVCLQEVRSTWVSNKKTNIPSPLYFVVQYAFTLTVTDTETDKNGLCMVV